MNRPRQYYRQNARNPRYPAYAFNPRPQHRYPYNVYEQQQQPVYYTTNGTTPNGVPIPYMPNSFINIPNYQNVQDNSLYVPYNVQNTPYDPNLYEPNSYGYSSDLYSPAIYENNAQLGNPYFNPQFPNNAWHGGGAAGIFQPQSNGQFYRHNKNSRTNQLYEPNSANNQTYQNNNSVNNRESNVGVTASRGGAADNTVESSNANYVKTRSDDDKQEGEGDDDGGDDGVTTEAHETQDGMNEYISQKVKELLSASAKSPPILTCSLDQRDSMIKQLKSGQYECMICCANIRCDVAIWNCSSCYHVFHLYCIKKWARTSVDGNNTGWRCPTCQHVLTEIPSKYNCFCGKITNPQWNHVDIPHSCGELCAKRRTEDCIHKCNILCHPGPCPTCELLINRQCLCGKTSKSTRCGTAADFKCANPCEKMLNCGKHDCTEICHKGVCKQCNGIIIQECHGKHTSREIICGSAKSTEETYACDQLCTNILACGNHECGEMCHQGNCGSCDRLPENVVICPCGKMRLSELNQPIRTSCLDPLTTCDNICGNALACGSKDAKHSCQSKCHDGPCPPCSKSMQITCVCGALTETVSCTQALLYSDSNIFKCKRRCKKKRSCGKHKCNQVCCVDTEHLCTMVCNRRLSCTRHRCDRLCHSEDCLTCSVMSYDELRCECGTAVIYPPVACGTKPPDCTCPCTREHSCEHEVRHHCHSDVACPPCVVLMSKQCMGGHEVRKNIPCHQTDVSCGLPCDKPLSCGIHKCQRICHKNACLTAKSPCTQKCPATRELCGHPCMTACHGKTACPDTACQANINLTCRCGNRTATVKCMMSRDASANTDASNKLCMSQVGLSLQSLQYGQSIDLQELCAVTKGTSRQLDCDSGCALIERNKRVALALQIKNPILTAKLGPPSYTQFLKDFTKDNQQFVATIEKQFAELVQKAHNSKQVSRSHSFQPMTMNQRRFIHDLAPFYGCETQSYDSEPKKNVVLTAFNKKSWLPSKTLTMAIQREERPPPPVPIPHLSSEAKVREANREALQSTQVVVASKGAFVKPSIDYFDMTPL